MSKRFNFLRKNIFLWSTPFIVIIGVFNMNKVLDINIHDTYYIINQLDFFLGISIVFLSLGFVYFILEKLGFKFSKIMTIIQFILLLLPIINYFLILGNSLDRFYTVTSYPNPSIVTTIIIIFISFLVFITNLIIGFKNRTKLY